MESVPLHYLAQAKGRMNSSGSAVMHNMVVGIGRAIGEFRRQLSRQMESGQFEVNAFARLKGRIFSHS